MFRTTSTRPLWAGGLPLGAHTRRRKALLLAQHAQAQRSTNHKSPFAIFVLPGCARNAIWPRSDQAPVVDFFVRLAVGCMAAMPLFGDCQLGRFSGRMLGWLAPPR